LNSLRGYEPAYLAGFRAQRYQIELAEGFEKAKLVIQQEIDASVRQDIGGDEQRVSSISTTYSNIFFLHLLLPVWIGAYRFQGKVYHVVVNARSGEVQGERPYSKWKIASLVLGILAVVIFLMILNNH